MEGGYYGLTVSSKTMLKFNCNCDGIKRKTVFKRQRGHGITTFMNGLKAVIVGRISSKGKVFPLRNTCSHAVWCLPSCCEAIRKALPGAALRSGTCEHP